MIKIRKMQRAMDEKTIRNVGKILIPAQRHGIDEGIAEYYNRPLS